MSITKRRANLVAAVSQFLWQEIKTMNMVKARSLGRVVKSYLALKFTSGAKKKENFNPTTYRISSY